MLQPVTDHVAPAQARARGPRAIFVLQSSPGLQRVVAAVAVVAFFAALFALCRATDQRADRGRPMYRDVLTLAWAQYDRPREGGQVLPPICGPAIASPTTTRRPSSPRGTSAGCRGRRRLLRPRMEPVRRDDRMGVWRLVHEAAGAWSSDAPGLTCRTPDARVGVTGGPTCTDSTGSEAGCRWDGCRARLVPRMMPNPEGSREQVTVGADGRVRAGRGLTSAG